jgi:hypothetical protein
MLSAVQDVSVAEWITPRLGGEFGAVTRTVPGGFAAYARICHPVRTGAEWRTWAEVAAVTGRQAHSTMQWHAVLGSDSLWHGDNPDLGNLAPHVFEALLGVLAEHTTSDTCWFCLWDGYGGLGDQPGPRVELPWRDYLLFTGGLRDWSESRSPNLFWPDDRAWCVASEIDFDSTLVAGSRALVEALCTAPGLEAWTVEPGDSLAVDGDLINEE